MEGAHLPRSHSSEQGVLLLWRTESPLQHRQQEAGCRCRDKEEMEGSHNRAGRRPEDYEESRKHHTRCTGGLEAGDYAGEKANR